MMSIRVKLLGAFLLVALLVPLLGSIAVNRVDSVNGNVEELTRDAVPKLLLVKYLDEVQREQELAVLSYLSSGKVEERQRYQNLSQRFDAELAQMGEAAEGGKGAAWRLALAENLTDERTKFTAAAGQLLGTRATVDRNLAEMRARDAEIVQELSSIRRRFVPASGNIYDPTTVPVSIRSQINDLLLSTEGMLRVVALEIELATSYTINPDDKVKQQFESAGTLFNNWLQVGNADGGPDDRAILSRVQTKFFKEFEPSARSMMLAAENSVRARSVFTEASVGIRRLLDESVERESLQITEARGDAESAAGSTNRVMIIITIIAFLLAGALALWFAGTITRPLLHLRDAADRISTGDVEDIEVDVTTNDEVGDLADAFRRMVASVRFLMERDTDAEEENTAFPTVSLPPTVSARR